MTNKNEALKLAQDLRALADRFSDGWHEGIKIDASDIVLLSDAAEALAEQPQDSKKFDPNESFAREEAAQARVREFMRNH